jgi:hypothetical protein
MTGCCYEANDTGRSGAGDESTGRNVAGDGEADHLVSGSGDPGDQLPADAALAHEV